MISNSEPETLEIICGDAFTELKKLETNSVMCCITSPPYWGLRDYGTNGQLGLEQTPEEYIENLVRICKEIRRVLQCWGTFWLNLGDTYAHTSFGKGGRAANNSKQLTNNGSYFERELQFNLNLESKNLLGIPWRVALALQKQGWYLRSDIIWHKPNSMPESVTDRPTRSHEYLFLLTKTERYYYNHEAIAEPSYYYTKLGSGTGRKRYKNSRGRMPSGSVSSAFEYGRNKRSIWTIATAHYSAAHFATFPKKLVEPCILAGTRKGDIVLDPFAGSGTVGEVALEHRRSAVLIELNPKYLTLIKRRCSTWRMEKNGKENMWEQRRK